MNFKSYGTLHYHKSGWISLTCCKELARYYRASLKKKHLFLPRYGSHITVCSGRWEEPADKSSWGKYEGKEVEFTYSNKIYHDGGFYWLRVQSEFLWKIRNFSYQTLIERQFKHH